MSPRVQIPPLPPFDALAKARLLMAGQRSGGSSYTRDENDLSCEALAKQEGFERSEPDRQKRGSAVHARSRSLLSFG